MKKTFKKETIIGLSVLLALVALIFGINYLKGINIFKASNYYYATYTKVDGLAQSAPVTVNGFKVGIVREINYEYSNPGHIKVELSLDRQLRLPKGTVAVLTTDMLGTSTIALEMGVSDSIYAVGDMLPGRNAASLMDALSGDLMPSISTLVPHIDSLITAANAIVSNPALTQSIDRLDHIMANLEATSATLPKVMQGASKSIDNITRLSADLNEISASLTTLAHRLENAPIDSTLQHIDNIAARLDQATAALNSESSTLGLLLHDPELYRNLNATVAHIDSILIDLKQRPRHYIPPIKVF